MNPDDDALIDAELSDAEKDQVQTFDTVVEWLEGFWSDGRADQVTDFLETCVDVIRFPAHPDNSGNRPAVIARLREIAELRLQQVNGPRE